MHKLASFLFFWIDRGYEFGMPQWQSENWCNWKNSLKGKHFISIPSMTDILPWQIKAIFLG